LPRLFEDRNFLDHHEGRCGHVVSLAAAKAIGEMQASPPATDNFLRPNSKWHRHLRAQAQGDNRLREVAVLFQLHEQRATEPSLVAASRMERCGLTD
jgi:hypothetical protein